MRFKRRYYYFVAGLADLLFDSGRNFPDMSEFRKELQSHLHPADYNLTSLLFLSEDNRNLISFMTGSDEEWAVNGNFSPEHFEEQLRILNSILKEKDILPDYMVRVMRVWQASEEGLKAGETRKELAEGCISMAHDSGNQFLRKWMKFDTDLQNIFTFVNSKSLNIDPADHLVGDDPFREELLELYRSGKDFSISFESDYASSVFKIIVENEFLERERRIDLLKWDFIDTVNFFEFFTIDMILGYLIKYSIVLRWARLDPERGRELLHRFLMETESKILSGKMNEKE
ncbi:MAG TPA: DUF2764 family protein [Bacteroidales bacterium]|nr:DUF2764 family protein [Bacteroidales bacterium]HPF02353.1 DUF2764 family protein [Bacteroidales bacterium]HPJ58198.1 DUF2764 family protein [Bacteroidales bacterium]HPR11529.1 DUF2764 family protein [Bacteroidales bacterium]HRW84271.1 DUF2764 family protein [Bacteroidales bacterium]